MRIALLPAALAVLVLAAPSSAQEGAAKANSEPVKVICKRAKATGTRLGSRRVCASKEQWRQREKDDQELLNKIQANSRLSTTE